LPGTDLLKRYPGQRDLLDHRHRTFRGLPILLLAMGLLLAPSSCSDGSGPTGPDTSKMEILILGGDGQVGETGALLPDPLKVRVQTLSNGKVEADVEVTWEVVEGEGAQLEFSNTVTDVAGVSSIRLTLGSGLGDYRVRASVKGMASPPAEFRARVTETPELTLVPTDPVQAGETIHLEGLHLSPVASENVVTFSNIRGRVLSATETALEVVVPPCLPTRGVHLQVQIGALTTPTVALEVLGGDEFLTMEVGEDRILDASDAMACFRLPSSSGTSYLVVPHTTGTVGGAEYPVLVTGLTTGGPIPAPSSVDPSAGLLRPSMKEALVPKEHWAWEERLRVRESEILMRASSGAGGPGSLSGVADPAPQEVPEVGDTRQFKVLNSENGVDKVTARVRLVTEHSLIYMDEETPSGGFTDQDLVAFSQDFDDPIHPTVTGVFGSESDLDSNGRVIILFTPGVNRLTTDESGGYVGGFFFGLDLLTDQDGSNGGEIFYAVVPDPTGIHGPVLSRTTLLKSLPAILAHEFEHMVHFNQRILVGGATAQDALWLSEALAQMAEDLVGEAEDNPIRALDYQSANWDRARRFLLNPKQVSVLTTVPPGTLAERGAGWLLLRHLYGREGEGDLLRALTGSQRTGVENVTTVIGRNWPDIVSDWAGSLYLDGLSVPVRTGLTVLGLNLREALAHFSGTYPLDPGTTGGTSFSNFGNLWSSAPDYYILTPSKEGGVAVNVSGPNGRPPGSTSGLRILVVRLR
jgi:hypothetical protein